MMVVMHLNKTNGRHVYWGTADRPTGFCVMGGPIFCFFLVIVSVLLGGGGMYKSSYYGGVTCIAA